MDELYIVKLPILRTDQNSQSFFILETIWKTDSVNLSIINGNEQFTGKIEFQLFEKISTSLEIQYELFFNETKQAITTNNGVAEFSYFINENEFIWKKEKGEKFKIIYGKVSLEKIETNEDVLVNAIDQISNLKRQLRDYKKDQLTAVEQITDLKKLLQQATEKKEEDEKQTFIKFIALLNSKKEKINELKSSLKTSAEKQRLASKISDEEDLNVTVVEVIKSSDSESDSIPTNLPKRRKFIPTKVIKEPSEKEVVSSQKSSADSEDLFKDM